jgi:hypothetical protein
MPTSDVIRLKNVRLSFPSLFKAKLPANETDPDKAKFKATFLLDPSNAENAAQIKAIKALSAAIEKEQWPKGPGKMKGRCWDQNPTKEQHAASVAAAKEAELEAPEAPYDGWEGMFSVVTSESVRPKVVNAKGIPVSAGDQGAPYAGCFVDAWVSFWTQDNMHGKRVNANLYAVQFRTNGAAFSSRPKADDIDFEDLSGQADSESDELPF